jgi:thioredoxin reductase-like selenoprotein T
VQAQTLIAHRLPGVEVVPSNYPPPPHKAALARLLGYLQYATIAAALFAERVLPMLGYPVTPELAQTIKDKRFGVIVGTWWVTLLCAGVDP